LATLQVSKRVSRPAHWCRLFTPKIPTPTAGATATRPTTVPTATTSTDGATTTK